MSQPIEAQDIKVDYYIVWCLTYISSSVIVASLQHVRWPIMLQEMDVLTAKNWEPNEENRTFCTFNSGIKTGNDL